MVYIFMIYVDFSALDTLLDDLLLYIDFGPYIMFVLVRSYIPMIYICSFIIMFIAPTPYEQ